KAAWEDAERWALALRSGTSRRTASGARELGLGAPASTTSLPRAELLRAVLHGDHELEAGPDLVDGADLDIDQAVRKCGLAHQGFGHIRRDAGGLLRPRRPDHAVRRDRLTKEAQSCGEAFGFGGEEMDYVERRLGRLRDGHTVRQLADDIAIGHRKA